MTYLRLTWSALMCGKTRRSDCSSEVRTAQPDEAGEVCFRIRQTAVHMGDSAPADEETEDYTAEEEALIPKIRIWNQENEYQTIINAVEALPATKRTLRLTSELARAYNNLAQPGEDALFLHALELLESCRAEQENTHEWNFRTAYALFIWIAKGSPSHIGSELWNIGPATKTPSKCLMPQGVP